MTKKEFNKRKALLSRDIESIKERVSPKFAFLDSIQEQLKKACELHISFKRLCKAVNDRFEQNISESMLKRYCKDKKFYAPKPRTQKEQKSQN